MGSTRFKLALDFKPVTLEDKEKIESYLSLKTWQICDYTFANLFLWSAVYKTEWCEFQNFLILKIHAFGKEKLAFLEPLGNGDSEVLLRALEIYVKEKNDILRMQFLSEDFIQRNKNLLEKYSVYEDRNYANYIYGKEKLQTLAGKKLQAKRNHFYHFIAEYPEYHIENLNRETFSFALEIAKKWKALHPENFWTEQEFLVIQKAFENFESLKLRGIVLFVQNTPVAFTFGSFLNAETFCVHIEKALLDYNAAFTAINKLFAETLPKSVHYLNREEDLGDSGLRKSKSSYHPDFLAKAYFLLDKNADEFLVYSLWKEAFQDDDSFIFSYLNAFSTSESRILKKQDALLIGMLHLHYFSFLYGIASYIYALAVKDTFRNQGIATSLVEESLKKAEAGNATLAFAIQGNKNFNAWKNLGFFYSETPLENLEFHNPENFFFSSEEATDKILVRLLNPKSYLENYLNLNPDFSIDIFYYDALFEKYSGHYFIQNQKLFFEFINKEELPQFVCTPEELLEKAFPETILEFLK